MSSDDEIQMRWFRRSNPSDPYRESARLYIRWRDREFLSPVFRGGPTSNDLLLSLWFESKVKPQIKAWHSAKPPTP